MANYEKARVKLTYNQLKRLESTAKNKAETTLRITKKNFQYFKYEELPHELFLTKRQKTKIRNAFANNISTDINHNCLHQEAFSALFWANLLFH